MTQRLLRQDQGALCTLTLDRPDKLNALDKQSFRELETILDALENAGETIGCVVLRGTGRAFCAGADLGAIDAAPERDDKNADYKPRLIDRLANLPMPTVAAVHGVCYTGGLELALACDFILADTTARFADTHGTWGLVGAWGMMQRLPRRIGMQAAKRMMMTAEPIDAMEAKALGLVDQLADAGGLDALVQDFTAKILSTSRHTNFAIKRTLLATDHMPLDEALAYEAAHYPGFAPDYAARVARFGKK